MGYLLECVYRIGKSNAIALEFSQFLRAKMVRSTFHGLDHLSFDGHGTIQETIPSTVSFGRCILATGQFARSHFSKSAPKLLGWI